MSHYAAKNSDVWAIPELSTLVVFGNAELGHPKLLWIKKWLLINSRGVTICPWIGSHVPCSCAVPQFLKLWRWAQKTDGDPGVSLCHATITLPKSMEKIDYITQGSDQITSLVRFFCFLARHLIFLISTWVSKCCEMRAVQFCDRSEPSCYWYKWLCEGRSNGEPTSRTFFKVTYAVVT